MTLEKALAAFQMPCRGKIEAWQPSGHTGLTLYSFLRFSCNKCGDN